MLSEWYCKGIPSAAAICRHGVGAGGAAAVRYAALSNSLLQTHLCIDIAGYAVALTPPLVANSTARWSGPLGGVSNRTVLRALGSITSVNVHTLAKPTQTCRVGLPRARLLASQHNAERLSTAQTYLNLNGGSELQVARMLKNCNFRRRSSDDSTSDRSLLTRWTFRSTL